MSNCATCGSPLKTIPAGISKKTGKRYNSFQACPNNCQQPRENAGQTREPINQYNQQPAERTDSSVWEAKDLRIAKEAALHAISRTMPQSDNPMATAELMVAAADVLVDYIYRERNTDPEGPSDLFGDPPF